MKILTYLKSKRRVLFKLSFILLISFFFQVFILELVNLFYPNFSKTPDVYVGYEKYDPSLGRLASIEDVTEFCDSLYGSAKIAPGDSGTYANIVSRVMRYRFVHGYSWYHLGHNYVATLLAPMVHRDLSAIVVPDDILKYPNAACSQQSIVAMNLLMEKGFMVRKVGFYDKKYGGHFCYEVRYDNSWHFYDPNREPDEKVLADNGRPSIEELNKNKELLIKAFPRDSAEFVTSLYSTYSYGKEGKLPGKNAIIFQTFTKFLSYFLWLILVIVYILLNRRFFGEKNKE